MEHHFGVLSLIVGTQPQQPHCEQHATNWHLLVAFNNGDKTITKAQSQLTADQILDVITTSLDDDKAEDIITIPLAGKSSMADYMVIASGSSSRQVAAMAEHIEFKLKQQGTGLLGLEGMRQADWVLLDANDVIVHLFRPEVRDFYGLEGMWADSSPEEIVTIGKDG